MSRRLLAICDDEPVYARKLMEQICLNPDASLQVRTFSDASQLFQYSKKHEIDLLLMGDCFQEEIRYKIPAKRRFLLARDGGGSAFADTAGQETVISKYQSAEMILQQLLGEEKQSAAPVSWNKGNEKGSVLIGVYSPIHRIGKTRFALELAEKLSLEAPVLYLNLEEYSGLGYCVPDKGKEHLGDLLYYAKQAPEILGFRLSTMVGQLGGVDYVQPIPVTRDIREVRVQEWLELFRFIREKSIYQSIVLDIGECVQGLFEILRTCGTVYTPYICEEGAQAKLKQYTDNLLQLGYEDVMEHTIQKEMVWE